MLRRFIAGDQFQPLGSQVRPLRPRKVGPVIVRPFASNLRKCNGKSLAITCKSLASSASVYSKSHVWKICDEAEIWH
jgi:hypothetical protein